MSFEILHQRSPCFGSAFAHALVTSCNWAKIIGKYYFSRAWSYLQFRGHLQIFSWKPIRRRSRDRFWCISWTTLVLYWFFSLTRTYALLRAELADRARIFSTRRWILSKNGLIMKFWWYFSKILEMIFPTWNQFDDSRNEFSEHKSDRRFWKWFSRIEFRIIFQGHSFSKKTIMFTACWLYGLNLCAGSLKKQVKSGG